LKIGRFAAMAAVAMALVLPGPAAHAQFAGFTGNARFTATTTTKAATYGNITFYPFVGWEEGGRFGGTTAGTASTFGVMTSGNFGFKPAKSSTSFEIGGWYWNNGPSDLYQINARVFPFASFGFQIAYLASTIHPEAGSAETYCLVYDLNSKRIQPTARKPWQVELGLGAYVDNGPNGTSGLPESTGSLTVFAQASFEIAKHVSLTASDWYVRDRATDFTRFAAGIGYSFQ
jgi:hypothetical protein